MGLRPSRKLDCMGYIEAPCQDVRTYLYRMVFGSAICTHVMRFVWAIWRGVGKAHFSATHDPNVVFNLLSPVHHGSKGKSFAVAHILNVETARDYFLFCEYILPVDWAKS